MTLTYEERVVKGWFLEHTVRHSFIDELSLFVENHLTESKGVDVKGFDPSNGKLKAVAECLNWYGGHVSPERLERIIKNLLRFPHSDYYIVVAGAKLTKDQEQYVKGLSIKVIQLPSEEGCSKWNRLLRKGIRKGVITPCSIVTSSDIIGHFTLDQDLPSQVFWIDTSVSVEKNKGKPTANSQSVGPLSAYHATKQGESYDSESSQLTEEDGN